MTKTKGPVSQFVTHHYRHFNAATLVDAAKSYEAHLDSGGKMFVTLAGAMSTAEMGVSLAEMIREDKIHGICCTGANLEEDIFNLVARDHYVRIPNWRNLTPQDEEKLLDKGLNRVTDTCIPEDEAMRKIEKVVMEEWAKASVEGETLAPHQFLWRILKKGALEKEYQIDPKNSWVIAAMEKDIPIFTPGWEDSTLGNFFAAGVLKGQIKTTTAVESGIQLMHRLIKWYQQTTQDSSLGFFQIGGGIAGDFPICVVPLIYQDLKKDVKLWSYFCQISDSTTSYGSYSGAIPSEKITWGKLSAETPSYVIESDATIVAPLIFAYVLGW